MTELQLAQFELKLLRGLETLMALTAEFQAQLTRMAGYVATLEAAGSADAATAAKDAEDTAALTAALDAAGAPPAPTAPAAE